MEKLICNSRRGGVKTCSFARVVALALVGATLSAQAGLVAKWDFNNYDPANPTSTNVLQATVGEIGRAHV